MIVKKAWTPLFALALLLSVIPSASATERLCDASFEDCRAPLLQFIKNENKEIDLAFWFMDDTNISNALIAAKQRGVTVRMLVDPRADEGHPTNTNILNTLASDGFQMRQRVANGILHWKMMLFSGQGVVQFSGANYSAAELKPFTPYVNYTDEAIYFSDDANVVNSFRTKYDDWWTDTVSFTDYANTSGLTLTRAYPKYLIDPEMDFLPTAVWQNNYGTRSQGAINAERVKLDIDMFRITNAAITDTTISAFTNRGLPIRMIVDSSEYRNPARVWDSYNVDRLFMAGIPMKITKHQGQNHEKSLLLYGQAMTVFGSSNWTTPSFNIQQEHNYFPCSAQLAAYTSKACFYASPPKPWFFQWFQNQFERRWNSKTEYKAFVPLGPGVPGYKNPANGATSTSTSVTLIWEGGPWAQRYDIYFGTASNPPLIASNVVTGQPEDPRGSLTPETFKVSGLTPGTTYRWKIVSKTMANLTAAGPIWSFTTAASTPGTGATVSSITPTSGPSSGGTAVTITGKNFAAGATVSFGFATATNVVVVNSTTITAMTPPHAGGTTGVTVINKAGDTGTLSSAFTFIAPVVSMAPRLNLVSPATGSPAGGDAVVITGINLGSGATVMFGGAPATVISSNPVSINVTTPDGNPGPPVDVVVTRNGQSGTLKAAYTYADPPAPPTVASVSPPSGTLNGGTTVTITGTGFNKGAIVTFGGSMAITIAVVNGTTVLATTPAHVVGAADVVVTNIDPATGVIDSGSGSNTLPGGYTYTTAPSPAINAVSPNSGTVSGGTPITITGSNFVFGAEVFVGGQKATVQTTTGSYIYATTPPAANGTGNADVTVFNPDGQSNTLSGGYTYQ
jgi:phosphatidylserine/phosphatidylglycerophosphate/cardiolipin synthase-like enzyme